MTRGDFSRSAVTVQLFWRLCGRRGPFRLQSWQIWNDSNRLGGTTPVTGRVLYPVKSNVRGVNTVMIRNTKSSWGSLSRWLHWGLGLAIIGMIAYGWWMNHIPAR